MDNGSHKLDDTQSRYTPDAGKVTEPVFCGVCGKEMTATLGVEGPRGFASAMAGTKSRHDVFECEDRYVDWHVQVVELRREAKRTPSGRIAKIMLDEAEEILQTRTLLTEM